ncbi:ABC uptake transporter, putative heme-binding protein [Candidatus Nitrososphaera gargensis Ga9.2]|uniref:ABC uptake transporter, putative heme-binding protein n=1 Tax=Nitrososphaera gargensis (strain Ga9.2) TaxID=1237085 RepID=K0IEN3_NITGG|nr:cobalamin-binding protein [Candidatus Nitrososphaera gargensis]AFU57238.1 ABC uptake transporter, putative heme-binding protein [Candidatus Nitrososphaera gargensis Ga9.2]
MRIVSFLPSATETLYQLGAGGQIVGVTHECKFPAQARKKPKVIRPSFDPEHMTGRQIDSKIVELMRSGKDIYIVDDKVLKKASPDLIVAQGLCEVCSPFTKEISRAVSVLGGRPDVLVLDPHDLDDILVSIMDVAEKVGRVREGRRLVASLQKRIDVVRNMKIITKSRPRVLCIEWLDPLFTAGHWVPQMVEYAGGINGISVAGEPSRRMEIDEAVQFNPDIIVLMPCGFEIPRTLKELPALARNEKWKSLRAVKSNNVYAVNANAYFSKPGPRTVVGLEILAKILHPEASRHIRVPKGSYLKIS